MNGAADNCSILSLLADVGANSIILHLNYFMCAEGLVDLDILEEMQWASIQSCDIYSVSSALSGCSSAMQTDLLIGKPCLRKICTIYTHITHVKLWRFSQYWIQSVWGFNRNDFCLSCNSPVNKIWKGTIRNGQLVGWTKSKVFWNKLCLSQSHF